MESNDSPEIPDRGETSDIPGLPLGEAAQVTGSQEPSMPRQLLPKEAHTQRLIPHSGHRLMVMY